MLQQIIDKKYNFYLFIGLTIIVVSLPFLFTHKILFLINRISIAFIILIWLMKPGLRERFKLIRSNYLLMGFVLMYGVELLGLLYSSNISGAASSLEKKLPLLVIPLIIITSEELDIIRLNRILRFFAGSVTIASLICLLYAFHRNNYLEVFSNPNWFYFSYYDLAEILDIQPIYFSVFVSFSFFVIIFLIKNSWLESSWPRRLFYFFWACYLFIFLVLLSGKTSIIATIFIFMAITFVYFQKRKRLLVGLLTILMIVVASGMIISKLPVVKERFLEVLGMNKTSDWVYGDPQRNQPIPEARLVKWQSAFDVIRDNWLFGVGSGDVQDELNKQYEAHDFQAGIAEQFNTHNQFLQTWVGTGLIGLVIFIATLIASVAKAIRLKNHFFLVFIALFMICCLTESMLERQFGILFYVIFSSLFYQRKTENFQFGI